MFGNPPVNNFVNLTYKMKGSMDFAPHSAELRDMMNLYGMGFQDYEKNKVGLLQYGFDMYLNMLVGE